jgi:transposase InsO family protein
MQHLHERARGIERLYLDFDSFFASAEQHFNLDLRGRPVGVVPLDALHTSHHTDRGSPKLFAYQKILRESGFKVSMSGPGNCYDCGRF